MLNRYTHNNLTWIDLESPTHDEVRSLMEEFDIDALVAEELLLPTFKPRVEVYTNFIYLILHFPALRHTHQRTEQEVDFIIGRNFIITTRYDTIDPIHKFSKVFEVNSVLDRSNIGEHAGFIFFYMLKKLYKSVEHENGYMRDALEEIESKIFAGQEKEMVAALSRSGRDLLNLRQSIEPHRDILRVIQADTLQFFGDDFAPYLRALMNEYYRVHNHIMRHTESLRELRETNNSLLTTKQNEAMKIVAILAFVTFPLSLVASIFGMNTNYLPIVGYKYDFWVIFGFMAFSMVMMFWYFKYKKWI
jgi:magnesium transporter